MSMLVDPTTGFSGRRTAEIVGISYRQLDYWARTELLRPSLTDASGSGSRRLYSYRDLIGLAIIRALLDGGVHLGLVRDTFAMIEPHLDKLTTETVFVLLGNGCVVTESFSDILEAVGRRPGLAYMLPLGPVVALLDASIATQGES